MGRIGLTFNVVTLLVVTLTCVEGQEGQEKPRPKIEGCNLLTCKPPECYCPTPRIPMDFAPEKVPQMILFSFNGPLDFPRRKYAKDLFTMKRRNPNGSPIRATFFVSDEDGRTDYCTVNNMWAEGHEIASFSVSRREPPSWWSDANQNAWSKEIDTQKKYIVDNASIPEDEITGFRSPHLRTGGNKQYRFAVASNWTYDSTIVMSLKYNEQTQPKLWPYTMDHQADMECYTYPCPTASFPGFWQVPFQPLTDTYGKPCNYLDSCISAPLDADDIFTLLMESFNRSYNNNRVPMMVNFIDYLEFFEKNTPWALEGVHRFMDEVLSFEADDVWFVTYQDMIEWMRAPNDLRTVKYFPAFIRDLVELEDKRISCIEKQPIEALFNGPTVVVLEILACGIAYIVIYFNDD